jgi:hypothetical protein
MANSPPIPSRDAVVDKTGLITRTWQVYFRNLRTDIDNAPASLNQETLTGQSASIATTAVPSDVLTAGLYRVSWYARVTTAATTSSSLTVTIGWTEQSVPLTVSGVAMTGNTTTTVQNATQVVQIDGGTSITYATTYASSGATAMVYALTVLLEQLQV